MKKIIAALAALSIMGIGAYAADINFTPDGGGKWIFSNNPEAIKNKNLMNDDVYEPSYIMNNEALEPDLYDFLLCHINSTDTSDGYHAGFNIEVDMELTALKDSVITINKAFFEVPEEEAFIFSDGTWYKESHKVSCLNSLCSWIGVPMCELNGSWLYEPQSYEPVTLTISKGETLWLSDYIDGYTAIGYGKPSQLLGEIELVSGSIDMNVAAFKSGDEIGDRSGFTRNAAKGSYSYTRTQKGIADTLPRVSARLEYTIDSRIKDGDYIVNKVYNQYEPDGYATDVWCSHLNPQDDIWSQQIAVENDLVPMYYVDNTKLDYYGSRVNKQDRDNVWIWDTMHSDTTEYQGAMTYYDRAEYFPNYPLSIKRSNQGYAVSMGNYCIIESYEITASNTTNIDKYFEYAAETQSNILVFVEDEDGRHSGLLKGENVPAAKDTMASVLIPANSVREFSINVVLPINCVGGIRNSFQVCNESHIDKYYEDYVTEARAEDGPLSLGIGAAEVKEKLPQTVKDIIGINYDCYELIEGDNGYMLRWNLWDGCPYYYTANWLKVKTLYFLDENFNITDKYDFDSLICYALYYDGMYYVQDAAGNKYRSNNGRKWETYTKRLPLTDITFNNSEPSDWAEDEVRRSYEIDVTPYSFKDKLVYDAAMTRGDFCDIMVSMLELSDSLPEAVETKFSDVKKTSVARLYGAGIISGYDDGTFRPNNSISREEAAVILYRTAQYLGLDEFDMENSEYKYADEDDIAEWAKDAVYKMKEAKLMSGVGNDSFAPETAYTNEQSIATILRLYDLTV